MGCDVSSQTRSLARLNNSGLRAVVSAAWEAIHTTQQTKQVFQSKTRCASQPYTHSHTNKATNPNTTTNNHNPINGKQSGCMQGSIHVPFARGLAICSPFGQSASIPHMPGILFFSPAPERESPSIRTAIWPRGSCQAVGGGGGGGGKQ
jgi:hypothetical protein